MTHEQRIIELLRTRPGLDDDEISRTLSIHPRQAVNSACRRLRERGFVDRRSGARGKIVNFLIKNAPAVPSRLKANHAATTGAAHSRDVMAKIDFAAKWRELLRNMARAERRYRDKAVFTGPSLHFHLTSLQAACDGDIERFIEQVYALLPSWGMHRMGAKGPKMVAFKEFRSSVYEVKDVVRALQGKTPDVLNEDDWGLLERAFRGIHCMHTNVQLVGNSKVLAHWLPELIAPIDREYTLDFLGYNGDLAGPDKGWRLLKKITQEFFYPILEDREFESTVALWMGAVGRLPWHTSKLKVIDNLLIGLKPKKEDAS